MGRQARARSLAASLVALSCALPIAGCRFGPPLPDHSGLPAEAARALVREQTQALHDLSASVSLAIETADFEGSLGGALLLEPPGRLRLRATKLVQDVFDLVITPEQLELYWFPDRILVRRRASMPGASKVATRTAPDAAPGPESFVARLDGRALRLALTNFELPASELSGSEEASMEGRNFVVRATLADGERLTRVFDRRSLLLDKVTLDTAAGIQLLRASYDDYECVSGLWLPTEMKLRDDHLGATFTMEFDDVAVNEGVLPGAFELQVPPGSEVRDL